MNFQSLAFIAFAAVSVPVCLLAGGKDRRVGRWLVAVCSLLFYVLGSESLWGLVVLLAGCAVSRCAIRRLGRVETDGAKRKRVLLAGCGYHVAVLAAFKYAGFFSGGAVSVGWVPLGLSFFTFQQLWLLKEAYTGEFVPARGDSLLLYGLFFPTVTSGPILRPKSFFPQLAKGRFLRPDWADIAAGLYAICCGMAKKVLLADPLGIVVGNGYAAAAELSAPGAWLIMLAYTLQLYLDFSGYCDIASGLARLLGLRLPVNFDSPYRALSVGEFWKRWHMTLTGFLRECVYIPLGGSRRGAARTYGNILLVFLISGFWHGAGWTFLLWGAAHGLAQIGERALGARRERLPKAVRWGSTFLFLNVAWVPFRAPSLSTASAVLSAAFSGGGGPAQAWLLEGLFATERTALAALSPALAETFPWFALAALLAAALLASLLPGNTIRRMDTFRPTAPRCFALAVLFAWCVVSFTGVTGFIYSNF
ncbi:MBOAT family O-acyltransferase [Oscillibacter sp.]|uniref:MBOAT family O-acyltransferase n=1 Tax=Oscillibacter sp. TaxID=1945593 RepID=UPI002604F278|nr:MBOAT family O-acyltransferase [Oscillibacter sp.]MDD3347770.1 MBOAT family protein [Oscillibacter sp.]